MTCICLTREGIGPGVPRDYALWTAAEFQRECPEHGASRQQIDAPFPWFGGKRRVADVVWERFGDVPNYVEPFFGSGAVLLNRPASHRQTKETVNDKDGYVANFWRAVQQDSEQTAFYADNPVNENDLHARHAWLVGQRETLTARLEGDPNFYDAKIAGWWVWGICCWIGSGFCSGAGPWVVDPDNRQLVHLGDNGRGVNRQLVHLGNNGRGTAGGEPEARAEGVSRKRPRLSGWSDTGVNVRADLVAWFVALADRLRYVRVCSGDWSRVCGPSPTFKHGMTGVFLDPPYDQDIRADLYRVEEPVSAAVRAWAIENGKNSLMRIALCGYEGEHVMPDDWEVYKWKSAGGFGSQGDEESRGKVNRELERIWFSPACLKPSQQGVLL